MSIVTGWGQDLTDARLSCFGFHSQVAMIYIAILDVVSTFQIQLETARA